MAFDIRQLARKGLLRPGNSFPYSWHSGGDLVGSISVQVDHDRVNLSYQRTINGEAQQVKCGLWITACPGGFGPRKMFLCPCCGKRCAVVYFGGNAFACRKCLKLVYLSEGEDAMGRLWRKQQKIESRLLDGDSHYQRPKGMHWRTFNRLADKIDAIEQQKDVVCFAHLAPLLMRSGLKLSDL
jgi:hypothetical protein